MKWNSDVGYQASDRAFLYLQPGAQMNWEGDSVEAGFPWVEVNASARAGMNPQSGNLMQPSLDIRNLNLNLSQSSWRLNAGFQEVVWGETFGLPILDIVNPRDYRDPLLLDSAWIRIPVAALQGQLFFDRLTLQALITPFPRTNRFIAPGSRFDPVQERKGVLLNDRIKNSHADRNPEFGGKIGYLFENGFDVSFIYYHHWSRAIVYSLSPSPVDSSFELSPVEAQVNTLGTTLSKGFDQWVVRMDSALNLGQPLQLKQFGTYTVGDQWQSGLGVDYTWDGWSFGVQFQTEYDFSGQNTKLMDWMSARVSRSFWNGKIGIDFYTFYGVGNSDRWFQPQVRYNLLDGLSILLRGDYVLSSGDSNNGMLWAIDRQKRILLWATLSI